MHVAETLTAAIVPFSAVSATNGQVWLLNLKPFKFKKPHDFGVCITKKHITFKTNNSYYRSPGSPQFARI